MSTYNSLEFQMPFCSSNLRLFHCHRNNYALRITNYFFPFCSLKISRLASDSSSFSLADSSRVSLI